jgi:hypothetical protein
MRRFLFLIFEFSMLNTAAFLRITRLHCAHSVEWFRSGAAGECDNRGIAA